MAKGYFQSISLGCHKPISISGADTTKKIIEIDMTHSVEDTKKILPGRLSIGICKDVGRKVARELPGDGKNK